MRTLSKYLHLSDKINVKINVWDIIAAFIVLGFIIAIASAIKQMTAPFQLSAPPIISLDPSHLPALAIQTVSRMLLALLLSLLFTLTIATWAAKSPRAEKLIIPIIDVMQSIPVLAFLSLTITGFIALFPGSQLGPECATIFLIFTAQAWNMSLSFYQSLKTVPADMKEISAMFHLSAWQRFWRIEVPFATPGLLWNMMMSMSASWFSLVASEAITIGNQEVHLPGLGSYIATAIREANMPAVGYALIAMLIVILCYDQILFRPLVKWSEKFDLQLDISEKPVYSWVFRVMQRTYVMKYVAHYFGIFSDAVINLQLFRGKETYLDAPLFSKAASLLDFLWRLAIIALFIAACTLLVRFFSHNVSPEEIRHVIFLGCFTYARVIVVLLLSSLFWVPIGVWIGLRPKTAAWVQPIVQFLAAFPANLLYPLVVLLILKFHLTINLWCTALMALGAQWYILFNVIAGTSAIPKDLRQVADTFGLKGKLWWYRLILPAIFPYYITGAITAGGGAWNASLVAEIVTWGHTTLRASGLGSYIVAHTGDFPGIALGVSTMCTFVLLLNRLIWRPLYAFAQTRFQLD